MKKVSALQSAHRILSPSEVMHNRFLELQKRAAEAAQAVQVLNMEIKETFNVIRFKGEVTGTLQSLYVVLYLFRKQHEIYRR